MSNKDEASIRDLDNRSGPGRGNLITRRDFLKVAGIAGATVGLGAGLGGILTACGGTATTTSASGGTTTPAGATTTASAAASTTVTSQAELGRELKLGLVLPMTGPLAVFGIADKWSKALAEKAIGDGIVCGDNKKHKVTILSADSQSDANRASQVGGDLISNSKVDILMASGTPDTANPAADQAEALGTPFLANYSPWNAFVFGRGADLTKSFKWTYGHLLGTEQMMMCLCASFAQIPNNKKVAFLAMNNADGNAWLDKKSGAPVILIREGYATIVPGQYNPGSEDFTAQISLFKKEGCDVLTGAVQPPDFVNFWKQALQQGFRPKVPSMGLALDFPQIFDGLQASGFNLLAEQAWHPSFPFTDSLTGLSCQQLADQYEKDNNAQWTSAIGQLAKISWAVDVLKRTKDLDNKETYLDAIKTTKMETILGPIDFTSPIDPDPTAANSYHPHPNVYKPVYTGGQRIKGTKWLTDETVTSNPCAPMVATVPVLPYVYS